MKLPSSFSPSYDLDSWTSSFQRLYWEDDDFYRQFQSHLSRTFFTYDGILQKVLNINVDDNNANDQVIIQIHKARWENYIKTKSKEKGNLIFLTTPTTGEIKTLGDVGLLAFFILFPFEQISKVDNFCIHEMIHISFIVYYHTRHTLLITGSRNYKEYLEGYNDQELVSLYEKSIWWIYYIAYERHCFLDHIVGSKLRCEKVKDLKELSTKLEERSTYPSLLVKIFS